MRLRIGIVGAGRVGSALGLALARAGHHIVAATARSAPTIARLRTRLPEVRVLSADKVVAHADLVLVAVNDDALGEVVCDLAARRCWRRGQLVAHVSGAHGLDVLAPAASFGALPMALHPVMTFTGSAEDIERLTGICYGVTASDPIRPVAEALVLEMGGEPAWIPDEQRALYHAGLVIGANYLVTLLAEAADVLRRAGVSQPGAMLGPLVEAAVRNALRFGDGALTGPIARADARTVDKHVAALASQAPEAVAGYVAMARKTADRALAAGRLAAVDAEALLEVLAAPQGTAV